MPRSLLRHHCVGTPWAGKQCPSKPALLADFKGEDEQRVAYCESCARAIGERLTAVGKRFRLEKLDAGGLPMVGGEWVELGAPPKARPADAPRYVEK